VIVVANLQVKDIDDKLYDALKFLAKLEHRSISQEVIKIIEEYLQNNSQFENSTDEFLKLAGSWNDDRSADEIVDDIRTNRSGGGRFKDGIFD
jgi:plasmid stability protein